MTASPILWSIQVKVVTNLYIYVENHVNSSSSFLYLVDRKIALDCYVVVVCSTTSISYPTSIFIYLNENIVCSTNFTCLNWCNIIVVRIHLKLRFWFFTCVWLFTCSVLCVLSIFSGQFCPHINMSLTCMYGATYRNYTK